MTAYQRKLLLVIALSFLVVVLLLVLAPTERRSSPARDEPISGYSQSDVGVRAPARALR